MLFESATVHFLFKTIYINSIILNYGASFELFLSEKYYFGILKVLQSLNCYY